jgi:hypothetical protein
MKEEKKGFAATTSLCLCWGKFLCFSFLEVCE